MSADIVFLIADFPASVRLLRLVFALSLSSVASAFFANSSAIVVLITDFPVSFRLSRLVFALVSSAVLSAFFANSSAIIVLITDFPASSRLLRLVFALPFSSVSTFSVVYTAVPVADSSTFTTSAAVATPNPPQRRESAIRDARRERLVTPPIFSEPVADFV